MHELAFADATRQARSVVLQLELRPYAIGHELILTAQRSPLVAPAEDFTKLDLPGKFQSLINAVLVCSRNWRDNAAPCSPRWLRRFERRNRAADWPAEISAFQAYRSAGTLFPPPPTEHANIICNRADEEAGGRELGSPYLARLYNFLCGLPAGEIANHGETVFDFPFGLGNFLFLSALESEGSLRIENRKEQEAGGEFEKLMAEIHAERADPPSSDFGATGGPS
jgi:hypothetical protein